MRCRVSPLVGALRWLPIQARIEYKLSTLCHSLFLFIRLVFFMYISIMIAALFFWLKNYAFHMLRAHLDTVCVCVCVCACARARARVRACVRGALSVWNSRPNEIKHSSVTLHLKTLWRPSCLKPTTASKLFLPTYPKFVLKLFQLTDVLCVCVCVCACARACVRLCKRECVCMYV